MKFTKSNFHARHVTPVTWTSAVHVNSVNKFFSSVVLLMFLSWSALASDIRIVNNTRVDLTPIHEWSINQKGDRPMKHWKLIHVVSFNPSSSINFLECTMSADGDQKRIYIKNLPKSICDFISDESRIEARESELRGWIDNETKRLRNEQTAYEYAEYGSPLDVNHKLATQNLENKKDELRQLQESLSEHKSHLSEETSELAMFTGKSYAGKEI